MQTEKEVRQKARALREKSGLPPVGMGTFGSDKYDADTVANAVRHALKAGYRLFDCASVYGNEKEIGAVFKEALDAGTVTREEIFVASKVWNDKHGAGEVIAACKQSLADLGLAYLDLYFVHWPFPNYHAPHCDANARNPDSRPFFAEEFLAVWRQMEQLQRAGLVKHIAMSNMTIPKMEAVLPHCEILPFAHEMELHPSFQQKELFAYCVERNILPIGYCPLGSPNRPERDTTPDDVVDTALEDVVQIAHARGLHPATVCLKWAAGNGHIPIPFSGSPKNIESNLKAVTESPLTAEEMERLERADQNCRLVKGHVFLWEGTGDWHALWDENNIICGWNA